MKYAYPLLIVSFLIFHFTVKAQEITAIPDPLFEQFLIDEGMDSDGEVNGQILTADAESVTKMNIKGWEIEYNYGNYIQDLTGIQAFVNLDTLSVNTTYITELPLESLIQLKYLDCSDNNLTSINLSNNSELEELIALVDGHLEPFVNTIESIDLSQNPNIKYIY